MSLKTQQFELLKDRLTLDNCRYPGQYYFAQLFHKIQALNANSKEQCELYNDGLGGAYVCKDTTTFCSILYKLYLNVLTVDCTWDK